MKWRPTLIIVILISIVGYFSLTFIPDYLQTVAYAKSDEIAEAIDKEIVKSNTEFALNIYNELVREDLGKNVFISPLSISTALTMAYNGAEGSTKEAMANTLKTNTMNLEKVNKGFHSLHTSLENADQEVSLSIGNSVWIKKDYSPNIFESFSKRLGTYYESEIFVRDFGDQKTVEEMNKWVKTQTNEMIEKIIDNIEPDNVMFLVNAIYFKGDWLEQFDESLTQERDFYLSDGAIIKPETMSIIGDFHYYYEEDFSVARFPYGRDKIAMYIFLPQKDVAIDGFTDKLSQSSFDYIISHLSLQRELKVRVPKFKLEYGTKRLNNVLQNLGMNIAFSPNEANFSGIAPLDKGNLFISFVDHKAVIEVNEKGTKAAAATNVGISLTSAPVDTHTFFVDRPFFFVIRDDRSGSILFMGKIMNPLESKSP
jgi:serpin B